MALNEQELERILALPEIRFSSSFAQLQLHRGHFDWSRREYVVHAVRLQLVEHPLLQSTDECIPILTNSLLEECHQ